MKTAKTPVLMNPLSGRKMRGEARLEGEQEMGIGQPVLEETARSEGQGAEGMLLRAGIKLFSEKGYAGTSVREIVSMAGVTKPVLYYYFKSKEGLFRAILDWASAEHEAILKEALRRRGKALERTIFLYQQIYAGVTANSHLFRLINNLFFGPPQGAPSYDLERFHRRMVEVVREIYLMGLRSGELKESEPDEAAFLLLGVIAFCFHLEYFHRESMPPKRAGRLLRLAFQGLEKNERGRDEMAQC